MGGATVATIYFFFMPFISVASILAAENYSKIVKSLKPLRMLLVSKSATDDLVERRNKLVREVREIVDELDWGHQLDDSMFNSPQLGGKKKGKLALGKQMSGGSI